MRPIDADALKIALDTFATLVGFGGLYDRGQVMECIDAAPTVATDTNVLGKWISVKERLPEKSGEYLVRLRYGAMKTMGFALDLRKVDDYRFKRKKPGWYEYDSEWGFVERDDITHYMPLPEPPKEDDT